MPCVGVVVVCSEDRRGRSVCLWFVVCVLWFGLLLTLRPSCPAHLTHACIARPTHPQVGQHNEKRQSWGQAIIIDPWGRVLADAGSIDTADDATGGAAALAPKIITAELDFEAMEAIRVKMPIQQHRRDDVFRVELVES